MTKSTITGSSKKRRGRPTLYEGSEGKGAPQIGLRLPPDKLAAIDAWIERQPDSPSRPVAIRRLVEIGLGVKDHGLTNDRQHSRARDMAATTIEDKLDPAAPEGERVRRKRRLIKGPEEFQNTRVDRPKPKK